MFPEASSRLRAWVGFALVCAVAPIANATEVTLSASWRGEKPERPAQVQVLEGSGASFSAELLDDEVILDLPAGEWSLALPSEDLWTPPRVYEVTERPRNIELEIWPAGQIEGRVETPEKVDPPAELRLRLESRDEEDSWELDIPCPLSGRRFSCVAPASTVDLKVSADGFVPSYFWDVTILESQARKLGRLSLKRGASMVGWVEFFEPPTQDADPALDRATVRLTPMLAGWGRGDLRRDIETMSSQVGVTTRGFFQARGLAPGRYRLDIDHPAASRARVDNLVVEESEEVEIPVVELWPPVGLEVTVDPPTDPYHQPWTVRLSRPTVSRTQWATDQEGAVDAEGLWVVTGLDRGEVRLTLRDRWGAVWDSRKVVLERDRTKMTFEGHRTRLEVALRLAGEAVPDAEVRLRNPPTSRKSASLSKSSDESGSAYFFLPANRVWIAEVRQAALGIYRQFDNLEVPERQPGERWPRIDLEFPDTAVEGQVVMADGTLLRTEVTLIANTGQQMAQGRSRPDGSFRLRGLEPGPVTLSAEWFLEEGIEKFSDTVSTHLAEGEVSGPVILTFEDGGRVDGVVLSPSGHGVPGTFVLSTRLAPEGEFYSSPPQTYTDVDGSFSLEIPTGVDRVLLQIFPPGFVPVQVEVERGLEEPLVVTLPDGGSGEVIVHYDRAPSELIEDNPGALTGQTWIYRDGQRVGSGLLLASVWNRMHGFRRSRPERLHVLRLQPGAYSICFGGSPLVPPLHCSEGFLAPNGTLEVTIPHGVLVSASSP